MATNEVMDGLGRTGGTRSGALEATRETSAEPLITTVHSPADLDAAETLLRRHRRADEVPDVDKRLPEAGPGIARQRLPGQGSRLLLARRAALPVGVARIWWSVARRAGEVRRGHLSHLYVVPEARSSGVGEALAGRAAIVAWWSGCHDLRVSTPGWGPEAVSVLQRAGFVYLEGSEDPSELVLDVSPILGAPADPRP